MITEEFSFLSEDGKHRIRAVSWQPDPVPVGRKDPVAVLQLIHGMGEHKGRYEEFAAYLAGRGFIVVMHDQLGHGDTAETREEQGFFAGPEGRGFLPTDFVSRIVLKDIHQLRILTQKKYPDLPYFMLGHSMGSYFLRTYLARYPSGTQKKGTDGTGTLSGAVIMGTGYIPPLTTAGGLFLLRVLALFRGWHYRSRLIRDMTIGSGPYKRFDRAGKEPERSWLSHNAESVTEFYSNPKSRFLYTLNGYEGLLETVYASCRMKNMRKIPKSLPLLIISGEDDPVGDLGKGVRKVQAGLKKAGHKKVTLRFFAGDRHEILHETDREKVFRFIRRWMEAQI